MKRSAQQPLTTAALALTGAALFCPPAPAAAPGTAALSDAVRLTAGDDTEFAPVGTPPAPGQGVALLMGGSGVPFPPVDETQWAFDHYSQANNADFGDYAPVRVFTPEGAEPAFGGVKSLPFDTSVQQGVAAVEARINEELAAGHPVAVGGVSQSSTINSEILRDIADGTFKPDYSHVPEGSTPLQFLSLGNPSNPNGGFLERFNLPGDPHPSVASIGLTFDGGAPSDTHIPVISYCLEYDPNCDFPLYTQNLVSDLNAMAGWALVHPYYIQGVAGPGLGVSDEQIASAQELPTTPGYDGGTTYYMMPWQGQLPLATVIQMIAGKPIADLLEPDLKVLSNLGYGTDPNVGWSQLPANVDTPLRVFPTLDGAEIKTIADALLTGAKEGFHNFGYDLTHPAPSSGGLLSGLVGGGLDGFTAPHSLTEVANGLSSLLSDVYSLALPVADITNALVTELPANMATVALHELAGGDLVQAVELPAAFATGLGSLAGGFLAIVGLEALPAIEADLAQIF